ncbi:MAG: hypothetical protein R3D44_12825, partial [Hyphomicrobiaceae bacterium]
MDDLWTPALEEQRERDRTGRHDGEKSEGIDVGNERGLPRDLAADARQALWRAGIPGPHDPWQAERRIERV